MTFYIISDAGQIVENYHNRPTDEQLQKLADEMELCLYVIEGDHTGMEAYPAIAAAPTLAAENARLREAAQMLIDYRDRVGPLNFQLEKADDFINRIRAALAGGEQ